MCLFNLKRPLRSRGSTGRTSANPMGHGEGVTGLHNIMVGRVVVLLVIAMAKKIWWCLEQPKGSLLEGHALFQRMLSLLHVSVSRVCCSLGHFGADSMKPVWVYSSAWDYGKTTTDCFVSTSTSLQVEGSPFDILPMLQWFSHIAGCPTCLDMGNKNVIVLGDTVLRSCHKQDCFLSIPFLPKASQR